MNVEIPCELQNLPNGKTTYPAIVDINKWDGDIKIEMRIQLKIPKEKYQKSAKINIPKQA